MCLPPLPPSPPPHTPLPRQVLNLVKAIEALKKDLGIPASIKEMVGESKQADYMASIPDMAEAAWDDQNTGGSENPEP